MEQKRCISSLTLAELTAEPKAYFKAAVVTKNLPDMQKEIRNLRKEVEELKQLLNK